MPGKPPGKAPQPTDGCGEAEAVVRLTPKPLPSAVRPDGVARALPRDPIIVIGLAPIWAIVSVLPFSTAVPPLNWTVPKLSRGTTPRPALGASSTHSADESDEL